jgi:hypothetical protein
MVLIGCPLVSEALNILLTFPDMTLPIFISPIREISAFKENYSS